jgi:leucyl aminopeptidase
MYFSVSFISSLVENSYKNIALELSSHSDLDIIWDILSSSMKDTLLKNLSKNKEEKKKVIELYDISPEIHSLFVFFPEEDGLLETRSEFFRGLPTDTLVIVQTERKLAYEALVLSTYSYQKYLSKSKEKQYWFFVLEEEKNEFIEWSKLYEAIYWARDLINTPPRDSNPEKIVEIIEKHNWKNFTPKVFDKKSLEKLWCELLLAVWAGSDFPPAMLILEPKKKNEWDTYAFIGKGVTFDAGGIQIKPDTAMLDMKCDMSGAAGVIGALMYLDSFENLPVNVIGAIGLTENMTGGKAFKPLDIYRAYNGTTVEIHHTDAEWRLVLADVMSYVEDVYKPKHIITMATLTGACVYALGHDIAGIMWDDETVISSLLSTSSPYEKVWRLPLNEKLKKSLKADIADLKNVARSEKAGSSIGGAFLSYFQWKAKLTHIDIAGPAYRETTWGYMPKGGTGWGVKILSEFILSFSSESKKSWKKSEK